MSRDIDALAIARRYLAAIERGAIGDELAAFYTPDVVQEELPNRLVPDGTRRDLAAILAGAERGHALMAAQRFEILSEMASGDRVALEARWTGTLAVALGSLAAGSQMTADIAIFLELRGDRIAGQRNYDCYRPR
jgi:ketosteroid isomerase-like protein